MSEGDDGTGAPGQRVPKLPSFGEALSRITAHFTLEGALGLLLIDAGDFAEIERVYGADAHQRAMSGLGLRVGELIGHKIGLNDLVLAGETGRNDILILIFREADEIDFYKRELPGALAAELAEGSGTRAHARLSVPEAGAHAAHRTGASLRNRPSARGRRCGRLSKRPAARRS